MPLRPCNTTVASRPNRLLPSMRARLRTSDSSKTAAFHQASAPKTVACGRWRAGSSSPMSRMGSNLRVCDQANDVRGVRYFTRTRRMTQDLSPSLPRSPGCSRRRHGRGSHQSAGSTHAYRRFMSPTRPHAGALCFRCVSGTALPSATVVLSPDKGLYPLKVGAALGSRTPDLFITSESLCQLS